VSSCSSSSFSSFSSVGYPNWVRGGLVAKLGTRRGHKHLRSGYEEEKGSVGPLLARRGEEDWRRRRGGKEKKREHPHISLALSPFLSLPLSNERMHERLLQTVESGERVLPWGSLFRAIDFHLLPSAQRHWRPWAREKEGLSDGDGTRARLTGGCSLLRASYLSFFPFLRPSTFLLPACCVNLHTDWHLFKPSCSLMTSLRLIILVRCLWLTFNPFIDRTLPYLVLINFEENGNPWLIDCNTYIFYFKYVGSMHENEL